MGNNGNEVRKAFQYLGQWGRVSDIASENKKNEKNSKTVKQADLKSSSIIKVSRREAANNPVWEC